MNGEAIINYEKCPGKIHIDNLKDDLTGHKERTIDNLDTIYTRIDGLKNLMIGALLTFVLGILGSTIVIMWAVLQ